MLLQHLPRFCRVLFHPNDPIPRAPMYRFSNSLPYLLARLGVRMGDLFERIIKPEKLTIPMYRVLAALSEQGHALRLGEIAALTSVDVSTLSRMVAEMARNGLLTRTRPENDQRSLQVALTPRGSLLVSRLMPLAAYYEEVAAGSLSSKEAVALKATLVQLYKNLDRLEQEISSGEIKIPYAPGGAMRRVARRKDTSKRD
jgi:MarR family transcriptional regulator, organic hydroperoxide resistance regulator